MVSVMPTKPLPVNKGAGGTKKKGEKSKKKPEVPHFKMPPTEGFPLFISAAKRQDKIIISKIETNIKAKAL